MSDQEKRSFITLISNIIVFVIYYSYIIERATQNGISLVTDISYWATAILLLLPVQIIAVIIIQIGYAIIEAIITKKYDMEHTFSDEREKLISLKLIRNVFYVFISGFFIAMGALAIGFNISVMFTIFFYTMLAISFTGEVTQIYFYRRGF